MTQGEKEAIDSIGQADRKLSECSKKYLEFKKNIGKYATDDEIEATKTDIGPILAFACECYLKGLFLKSVSHIRRTTRNASKA